MNLPGKNDVIWQAAKTVFDHLERAEQRANPAYRPRDFASLPEEAQLVLAHAQEEVLLFVVNILLADLTVAVEAYDGAMGAAYQRIIHRYAHQELGHQIQFPE
jgi:hypothetical protein